MDLVAGDAREIVLVLTVDDVAAFDDPDRFVAHLPLGGGLDPTWLDLFSEAVRSVTGEEEPVDFLDARRELEFGEADVERIVERVDGGWVSAVARVSDDQLGALAGRWIGLLEEELGFLPREEKPWIRDLAGQIVDVRAPVRPRPRRRVRLGLLGERHGHVRRAGTRLGHRGAPGARGSGRHGHSRRRRPLCGTAHDRDRLRHRPARAWRWRTTSATSCWRSRRPACARSRRTRSTAWAARACPRSRSTC